MADKDNTGPGKTPLVVVAAVMALVIGAVVWWGGTRRVPAPSAPAEESSEVRAPVRDQPVIDYNTMAETPATERLMDQRRARLGIEDGIDLIVEGDETVRIGDRTVSMAEIRRQIDLDAGRVIEAPVDGPGETGAAAGVYGIHVVKPGDNIWNIHFRLLRAYLGGKGVRLPTAADEPRANGTSSGIGRLLKFSEGMVAIYNLHEGRLEKDLDLIYPLSKIVIYNMGQVFGLLEQIDTDRIDHIRFDGETLWLPAPS